MRGLLDIVVRTDTGCVKGIFRCALWHLGGLYVINTPVYSTRKVKQVSRFYCMSPFTSQSTIHIGKIRGILTRILGETLAVAWCP